MTIDLGKLKGITPDMVAKLSDKGITNTDQLLAAAKTPASRRALAKELGADAKGILLLANRADLIRIKGISNVFSELLEAAGVDTVKELATRRADNLLTKVVDVNREKKISGRMPTLELVQDWINQAKELPKMLEY